MKKKVIIVDFDDTLFFTERCTSAGSKEVVGRAMSKAAIRKLEPGIKGRVYDLSSSKYSHLSRPNRKLIRILSRSKDSDIVVLTARTERSRRPTVALLKKHKVPFDRAIFRENRLADTSDEIWKIGKINRFAGRYREIDFYEDKPENIAHFKHGLAHECKSTFILVEADGTHRRVV